MREFNKIRFKKPKHFISISKIINTLQKDSSGFIGQESLIKSLSDYFKKLNPLFDGVKFREACLK